MIRRLLVILIAVSQLAALPLAIEPARVEVGVPISVAITLPDATTKFIGFPDLGAFALLTAPERIGNTFTLQLLSLRPGDQALPPLPFRSGQLQLSTAETFLIVNAPPTPESPHPLKPFPEPEQEPVKHSNRLLRYILVSLAVFGMVLIVARYLDRTQEAATEADLDQQFANLAAAVRQTPDFNNPELQQFWQKLEKVRFGPLLRNESHLLALQAEFGRLRGETT
jgi:hypothetical protein